MELGILLPFIAILFVGLFGAGALWSAQVALQSAVREGARTLAVGGDSGAAVESIEEALPDFEESALVVDGIKECEEVGGEATVTAEYEYVFRVPIVDMLVDLSHDLDATAVMRCEREGP